MIDDEEDASTHTSLGMCDSYFQLLPLLYTAFLEAKYPG